MKRKATIGLLIILAACTPSAWSMEYEDLKEAFSNPDYATWGEVPLWWWEGAPMTKQRATKELEELAAKGVKAVCPIQRSPGRCDPPSFSPDWWEMLAHVHKECRRLGMKLWVYDQVGYGHYGWLEKAAAQTSDREGSRIEFLEVTGRGGKLVEQTLPSGKLLCARAYPTRDGAACEAGSVDVTEAVQDNRLAWKPPSGTWKIAVAVAVPSPSFYLNEEAADAFLAMLYGKIKQTVGEQAMGRSLAGVFQDEHPPTPRDVYTNELEEKFREQHGYALGQAIPALHFDVGPQTQKYRTDFFDTYMALVEHTYWKRVFDWAERHDILTSHDNWGRNNIYRQSEGYIDYFRSQRWFSSPGYDDAGQHALTQRNYYDTKIAASIARLYRRPRVWNEAFHSSGWGRTTDQTLTWLTTGMAFGANLYDEHGLYYDTRAGTWEHAAPDPHWRQPYWRYYQTLSDYVARSSFLMSQGVHVVDAAVHYPVASLLAGKLPDVQEPDYNLYMRLSRTIFDAGIDNDIIDDDSIVNARVRNGKLFAGGNGYRALVFGPETTMRREVLEKAFQLAKTGGTILFYQQLPRATTESGRNDAHLDRLLEKLLGTGEISAIGEEAVTRDFPSGGLSAFIPGQPARLPELITQHVSRDFLPAQNNVFATHRRSGDVDIYLVQNKASDPVMFKARFRTTGVPEIWDAFSGQTKPVRSFKTSNGFVTVEHRLVGNTACFFVFRPGEEKEGGTAIPQIQPAPRPLAEQWRFSVIPTRNNRWGEFQWPPSERCIGPQVREFRYMDGGKNNSPDPEWTTPGFDDSDWKEYLYSTGPYWLFAAPVEKDADLPASLIRHAEDISAGTEVTLGGETLSWRTLEFSQTIGAAKAAPWGGHSGYPDGHIDKNFVELPKGRKLLFTRIRSPRRQRLGLRVELRNKTPRLWVNGDEQPFEDAVGNLPLREGVNRVLIDLPDGGRGRLFVQKTPPSVRSMEDAARGAVSPNLKAASWIWYGDGKACYTRRTFDLDRSPQQARVIISAFSGWKLSINGQQIADEVGPWADWRRPERFSITPYLRKGKNVIAIWGQLFAGQNVNKGDDAFQSRGIVAALAVRYKDGSEQQIVTDSSWKGSVEEAELWTTPGFDDSRWEQASVRGQVGDPPWGMDIVHNIGSDTEPRRPLSIHLDSPHLTCFNEVKDIVYDVKQKEACRIGYYRFQAPPGLRALALPEGAQGKVWVDGAPARVEGTRVSVENPPRGTSLVAVRLAMKPGEYAGAAFQQPISLTLEGGTIKPGPWADFALPTYSGIGVYEQNVTLDEEDLDGTWLLDLGDVRVAAKVLVNGRNVGVRLARPFRFDVTDCLKAGQNRFEVRVANTIAPHYTTIPALHVGPTESGLLGPVTLRRQLSGKQWRDWAERQASRLRKTLNRNTSAIDQARRKWERTAGWHELEPREVTAENGVELEVSLKLKGRTPRFVVAATNSVPPICRLPAAVAEALAVPEDQRTTTQQERVERFYRSVAPLLQRERDWLSKINSLLRQHP